MTEQGSNAWGLTVSRRFDTAAQAKNATENLRKAGFREEEIRVWQQKQMSVSYEDSLERTLEGGLVGAVIFGLAGFFLTTALSWTDGNTIQEQATPLAAIASAVIGAIVVAIGVNIASTKIAFSHPHHVEPSEAPSVVTVTVGDREAQAKQVFDSLHA
jgi:uncharacterized membrane protein YeaQ/YmgE (transglycosylase-associated protein family)